MRFLPRIFGRPARKPDRRRWRVLNRIAGLSAAQTTPGASWPGIATSQGDDSLNREYMEDLDAVISRAQDLDVNQPDLHGFNRCRTAKVIGRGVSFRHDPHPDEIGLSAEQARKVSEQIDRLRDIHSREGGFDAQGHGRSEGKQQERAILSMFVHGACLIHRVWRNDGRHRIPLSIELIPAYRISTPFDRAGDPKISYGIQYADNLRSRVTGFHVRRVSETIGDSFVQNVKWDFIPIEDAALLSLTEVAGIDRALPISTSTIRLLRNRGEFVESMVASARAQSKHYGVTEAAEGSDPYNLAADDAVEVDNSGQFPVGFVPLGDVQMLYTANGEKVTWSSAKLPDPDLKGFMEVTDARLARGLVSSLSNFTRQVNNSWAGGRLEDQMDDPIISQYRESFESAWAKVNAWFLEAIWLSGAIELPGYSSLNAPEWCEFRARYYAKVHINPADTMQARESGYRLRTLTPQQACEEDDLDLRQNIRQWAQAIKICREEEQAAGLPEGSIDFPVAGKAMTTSDGQDVAAASQMVESSEQQDAAGQRDPKKKDAARDLLTEIGGRFSALNSLGSA